VIRPASTSDADAIADIYAPVVRQTSISFELDPPDADEMKRRIERNLSWLVFEEAGTLKGYAYAAPFHQRAAYRWSAEISVYIGAEHRGAGVGKRLVQAMIAELTKRGYVNAFAGVALPNPASVRLFESFGFRRIALYEHVGFKLGRWHDVAWSQLDLREPTTPPPEPVARDA
jgi:phosphinothricin acetyltransferase